MNKEEWKCLTCYYYKNTEYIEPDDEHWKFSKCGNGGDYACVCFNYGLYKPKGLTQDKKKLFKRIIGTASNEKIDMNMIRDDYKYHK